MKKNFSTIIQFYDRNKISFQDKKLFVGSLHN
jgi:hypothetical protein